MHHLVLRVTGKGTIRPGVTSMRIVIVSAIYESVCNYNATSLHEHRLRLQSSVFNDQVKGRQVLGMKAALSSQVGGQVPTANDDGFLLH